MWKLLVLGCTLTLAACAGTPGPSDPLDRIAERAVSDRSRQYTQSCPPRTGTRLRQRDCLPQHTRVYGPNGDAPLSALLLDPRIRVY
jgi:hypothetical protein